LYGSDRAAIRESLVKGRHGKMPAFEGVLKPEEIKAVSVFVFSHAATPRGAPARREPAGKGRRGEGGGTSAAEQRACRVRGCAIKRGAPQDAGPSMPFALSTGAAMDPASAWIRALAAVASRAPALRPAA